MTKPQQATASDSSALNILDKLAGKRILPFMLYHAMITPKEPSETHKRVSLRVDTIGEAWEQLIAEFGARNVHHVWPDYGETKESQ